MRTGISITVGSSDRLRLDAHPVRRAVPGRVPRGRRRRPPGERGEAKCTHFRRAKGGPVVLFNRCRACRAVVVERASRGGARKSQTFAVAGGSYVLLAAPGVPVQARIVTEKPCG